MYRRQMAMIPLALVVGLLAATVWAGGASAQSSMTTTLSGAAEVPGPGSPTGSGTAMVTLNPDQGTVCYDLTVNLSPPAAAAHIHRGAADASGPVVVPFDAPTTGTASGCAQGVDAALIAEIMQTPSGFYVNVHNPEFQAGAIRGQLGQ
jgi:CHRD domain-containing protein